MHYLFFLKVILEFAAYTALYFLCLYFLPENFEEAPFISFGIVLLTNLFFGRILRDKFRPFIEIPFAKKYLQKKQVLEQLIQQLVGSIRYHQVKKLLFNALEKVLAETAHAFYILDNDHYYLSHYANYANPEQLPVSLDVSYFQQIRHQPSQLDITNDLVLPKQKLDKLSKAGMTKCFPFPGNNQIFALLFVGNSINSILKDAQIRNLFMRIQIKAGLILENSGLFIDLERKHFEMKKLIEVSQKILSSLDMKETLDFILDALNTLISYDAAAIYLLDDNHQSLKNTSSRGYDDFDLEMLNLKVGQGSVGHVVQSKKIDVISNVKEAEFYFKVREDTISQITLPLLFNGAVLGVICVESDIEDFFKQNEIEILKMFANQAAIAIHNARQVEIRLEKQAFEHELINAATVQKGLLTNHLPRLKNLNLTAENIPSKIVSGDLYDFHKISEQALGLAIGDVSGKGAPAALMMTLVLAGFRTLNKTESTTCDVVNRLNDLLTETTIEGKYTTFFYGIIRLDKNKIIYTNAGHNPPIIIKKNGDIIELSTGGIVLGFLEYQNYKQEEAPFEPGDLFIAFTDGVTEAMNISEVEFGENRLIQIVTKNRNKSVYEIKNELKNALYSFSHQENQADDLTLIIAKHE